MDVDFYPDEDWEVDSVMAKDVCAITLRSPNGDTVRIEATYSVLNELGRRWVKELSATSNVTLPAPVISAPYKTRTNTWDQIDQKIENLETLLNEHHGGEERRYPDDFQAGDWVQFPPNKAWRQIDWVKENSLNSDRTVRYMFGGLPYGQNVRPQTRYPYMTAAAMAAVPKQEA